MLVSITTTHSSATDLGYLLHKNPARLHSVRIAAGQAHVFYSEAEDNRCTVNVMLELDPVALSRRKTHGGMPLLPYVNDRPYAITSFMSTALAQAFRSAMNGTCKERPELVDQIWPFEITLPVLPSKGGGTLVNRLFEPLDYEVAVTTAVLDPAFPDWGDAGYHHVTLTGETTVREMLSHLYVMIPVLDNQKHYWVGKDEVDLLLKRGQDWLDSHPEKDRIVRRSLAHQGGLVRQAMSLLETEEAGDEEMVRRADRGERKLEKPLRLNDIRMGRVLDVVKASGASSVVDLGCGEGKLLGMFMGYSPLTRILGMDVSHTALERASTRLDRGNTAEKIRDRVELIHGSLSYRDYRLSGFDAAVAVEVIEHMEPNRLSAFQRVVFEFAQPRMVVITTPNREYNALFESLPEGELRHPDHRFEWDRAQFETWARAVAQTHGYHVTFEPIGEMHAEYGAPTQMGVFQK